MQHVFLNYRCVALYEMHQVQRPKVQGADVKLALFLFIAFGIGFPIVYLRWRYPIILFVCFTSSQKFNKVSFDKITFSTSIPIPFSVSIVIYTGLLWYINLKHCLDGFMFIVLSVHPQWYCNVRYWTSNAGTILRYIFISTF